MIITCLCGEMPGNGRKTSNTGKMGILNDLLYRVQAVNDGLQSGTLVRDVVVKHGDDILELQKIQLFEGKAANGEDIRPYYSEDLKPGGWFHSVESAGRYAAWKKDGINYPYRANRNPDAPNLYVNGKFHDELGVRFGADSVAIVGDTPYAAAIIAKYGLTTFGLTDDNWEVLFEERGGYNELMNEIKSKLYVRS